jgi:integrase
VVEENVWKGRSLPKEQRVDGDKAREFSLDEMRRLLTGATPMPELAPIMRIAALTGSRIDPIVSLRVKDCEAGFFVFKKQKREPSNRRVPIHSALVPIIQALVTGKGPEDPLFPAFPKPPAGSQREHSMPVVKAFGRYRKSVGVDDTRPGMKRSLVTVHSFRRWFITQAEQAGIDGNIISSVVGQKRPGMTLGLYSGGPAEEQLRACVEAVRLPE